METHLEHVGDHGASALDVDAAVAIVLTGQWLASGWRLLLATTLRNKQRLRTEEEGTGEL